MFIMQKSQLLLFSVFITPFVIRQFSSLRQVFMSDSVTMEADFLSRHVIGWF